MPPKKKDKGNGASDRPRDQPSLLVAFAKQIKLQKCTVCLQDIAAGVFAKHRRECRVREDDEECQVLFSQTAEEKWAAGLITLDEKEEAENSVRVKREKTTPTTSRGQEKVNSTLKRRERKRKIGEEGESAEDDSDFAPGSQESKEAEETIRRREEPVRTRRSARVSLQADASRSPPREAEVAADEGNDAMEMAADDMDATIRETEEDLIAAAAATPLSRRVTRCARQMNQLFVESEAPSPSAVSQSSSMEVETGCKEDWTEPQPEEPPRKEEEEPPLEAVNLDATLPPQEEPEPDTRRKTRGAKNKPRLSAHILRFGMSPMEESGGVIRRSIPESSQSTQVVPSSKETEAQRKRREKREEEKKKNDEETAKLLKALEDERKKKQEKERKEEEEAKKAEEERKKRNEQSIVGLTKIVLRALEDKCIRHEKGLVPSQELVQAPVVVLEEEDPQVVPHYVYLVCKIMKRVLSTVASNGRVHDEQFWGEDMRMISSFLSLKDDAKLLFIRLFTRKRGWHLPEKLKEKYSYLANRVEAALSELNKEGFLENGKSALQSTEETLRLCCIEKLKLIAKDFRVDPNKSKSTLIAALLHTATTQKRLFVSATPGNSGRLLAVAKKVLGPVYRTSASANSFFRGLFSLYSPNLTDSIHADDRTVNIISNMIWRMKEIHYETTPRRAPFPCAELIGVYESKEDLYEFVEAKESEERMMRAFDRHDMDGAREEAEEARRRLTEMTSRRIAYLKSLPDYHLQYTTEAILTRIVGRGVDCLERKKDYVAACNWIKFIVNHKVHSSLLPHSVGHLYERLALNLHHHCGHSEDAIDEIKRALEDPMVPEKNRLTLDDRAKRILKDAWESRFSTLIAPTEMVVEGETIGRDLGDERKNRFVKKMENGDIEEVSVEKVALDYYLSHGMEDGVHSEGEIWHTTFKLLFWDVIFSPAVEGVWFCELQIEPVDYNFSLYERRKEAFEEKFEWMRKSKSHDRVSLVEQNWNKIETPHVTMQALTTFLRACPLSTLVGVMEILVRNPRHRRSGFPDLVMWNATTRVITVAEVKGPGDTLSTKQRLWLDFFMKQDPQRVKAYLCKVTASGRKRLNGTQN